MRFAYADPPYLGMCDMYGHHHPDGRCWDDVETHRLLIERLVSEFPDGWAMSLHSPALRTILPLCPSEARVGAWTKPFASFKPGVNPAFCWEPVIFMGGRKRGRTEPTVRDYCAVNITLGCGFCGAKPEAFCWWVFDLLGMEPDDEFHDLFHGSGAVTRAWETYRTNLFVRPEGVERVRASLQQTSGMNNNGAHLLDRAPAALRGALRRPRSDYAPSWWDHRTAPLSRAR